MRYYGVAVELPFAFIETAFHMNSHDTFVFRHIATFFIFLIGVYFFYLLCLRRFKSVWLPLLGAVFLIVTPRMFADAFFNSKDIPTMVFFIISIYTLLLYLEKPSFRTISWHAIASALLISIRLPGLFVVVITVGFIMMNLIFLSENKGEWKRSLSLTAYYLFAVAGLVLLMWPYLWADPIANFLAALGDMSHFSRQAGLQMRYIGETVVASNLPWHYILVWILVTTPVAYIALGTAGIAASVKRYLGTFFENPRFSEYYRMWRNDLVVSAWLVGPLLAVVVLHSVLYDSWRQMYFVYPALLYLALVGIEGFVRILESVGGIIARIGWWTMVLGVATNLVFVLSFMIRNHPFQNLYFNALAGGEENARNNFEMDYWGLAFRKGLEYIAVHDAQSAIPVYFLGGSDVSVLLLPPAQRDKFTTLTDATMDKAKYIITNYRWQDYATLPWDKEFYSITVDGAKVMTVFKMY
jgi:hypothetical protein